MALPNASGCVHSVNASAPGFRYRTQPFSSVAITQSLGALNRIKRFLPAIEATSGAVLVATGIVVATDQFTRIAGFFYQYVKPPSI